MPQNKLSFESENLVVDYITFKFQYLDNPHQTRIAKYLFQLGFNSYQESGKLAKPIKESILVNSKNKFEVCFVGDNSYWGGTLLNISGSNAARFYSLIKQDLVSWKFFSYAILGRFDLYYSRTNKRDDKIPVTDFLENCHRKLKQTNKNVSFEKNFKGLILKIGSRRSNHYSRIYETKNSLKFEHEIKGKFLQKYHLLLVENRLEEFEQKLSLHFLVYFGKLLPLHFSYLDWLVVKLRPIRKQNIFQQGLNLEYIKINSLQLFNDRKKFISFLQFLVYAQNLDYDIDSLGSTSYRLVVFRVQDFLKYQNPTVKSTNYYQLQKLIHFFDELQTNSIIKSFTDKEYRSLVTIPEVKLQKLKQNCWTAKIWIAEELFYYTHPFLLPDLFKRKLTKHEFEVQFKVIQVFSSADFEKSFLIKEFFQNYPSTLNNQQKTKIKKYFIRLIQIFQEYELLDSDYKIISDGKLYDTHQLTSNNISEGFIVYERISI